MLRTLGTERLVQRYRLLCGWCVPSLIALMLLTACGQPMIAQTTANAGTRIRSFTLLSATSGWVLSDQQLLWTDDGGKTWRIITPLNLDAAAIRGVQFLNDVVSGWIVASGKTDASGATPLVVFRTSDAGKTWTEQQLAQADRQYTDSFSGLAHIQFLDRQRGWVIIRLSSSANFSPGQLFSTVDGGATWTQITVPTGDPVAFVNQSFGWNAGGPAGDKLFLTRDGGKTWQQKDVAVPKEFAYSSPSYALPRFQNDREGVLPVTFAGSADGPSAVGFYISQDGGQTWQLTLTLPLQEKFEAAGQAHTQIVDQQTWIVAPQEGGKLLKTADSGTSSQVVSSADFPSGVVQMIFATPAVGWARFSTTTCATPKTSCQTKEQLLQTTDGGQRWLPLHPLGPSAVAR